MQRVSVGGLLVAAAFALLAGGFGWYVYADKAEDATRARAIPCAALGSLPVLFARTFAI